MPIAIVVMGVSGSGKTTLGSALAARLGATFVEGDALHLPANIAKMSAGVPLTDDDRAPFLDNVGRAIRAAADARVVVSCSALKRRYRDRLRAIASPVSFVLPLVARAVLEQRLAHRSGHYMPASLLDSQLADLEPLGADEAGVTVDGTTSVGAQVDVIVDSLRSLLAQ